MLVNTGVKIEWTFRGIPNSTIYAVPISETLTEKLSVFYDEDKDKLNIKNGGISFKTALPALEDSHLQKYYTSEYINQHQEVHKAFILGHIKKNKWVVIELGMKTGQVDETGHYLEMVSAKNADAFPGWLEDYKKRSK